MRARLGIPSPRRRLMRLTSLVLMFGLLVGCAANPASPSQPLSTEVAEVVYRYTDSSVPPLYHRSYTVTVSPGSARIEVDSYGEVLAEAETSISPEQWASLTTAYQSLEPIRPDDGSACPGGTSRSLSGTDRAGNALPTSEVYVCGQAGEDEAARLEEIIEPITAEFDMKTLLA